MSLQRRSSEVHHTYVHGRARAHTSWLGHVALQPHISRRRCRRQAGHQRLELPYLRRVPGRHEPCPRANLRLSPPGVSPRPDTSPRGGRSGDADPTYGGSHSRDTHATRTRAGASRSSCSPRDAVGTRAKRQPRRTPNPLSQFLLLPRHGNLASHPRGNARGTLFAPPSAQQRTSPQVVPFPVSAMLSPRSAYQS